MLVSFSEAKKKRRADDWWEYHIPIKIEFYLWKAIILLTLKLAL